MESKQFCSILFWMFVLPVVGQGVDQTGAIQSVPPWLENINPADYFLITSDLIPPLSFRKIPYEVIKRDIQDRDSHIQFFEVWVYWCLSLS